MDTFYSPLSKTAVTPAKPRHNIFSFARLFTALCLSSLLAAAEAPTTLLPLGQGLNYYHITDLRRQLPAIRTALSENPALVLDARDAKASSDTAKDFRDALTPASPTPRVTRFVLINAKTAVTIITALGGGLSENSIPDVLVIAPSDASIPADLKAPCTNDDDRRACEALATGATPASLMSHQPEKQRYDESVLMREHNNQPSQSSEEQPSPPAIIRSGTSNPNTAASTPERALPPPTDAVLELAVQIHRSLIALKKL